MRVNGRSRVGDSYSSKDDFYIVCLPEGVTYPEAATSKEKKVETSFLNGNKKLDCHRLDLVFQWHNYYWKYQF